MIISCVSSSNAASLLQLSFVRDTRGYTIVTKLINQPEVSIDLHLIEFDKRQPGMDVPFVIRIQFLSLVDCELRRSLIAAVLLESGRNYIT